MDEQAKAKYIKDVEERIAEMREFLKSYEDGTMFSRSKQGDGPWIDDTNKLISRERRNIAQYEQILAALKKR